MSEKQPRGIPRIQFPLTVPRQGVGDLVPTASSQFAGQIRTFIGVSGYVDGLYICDTNLAGTWGWYKIHGHGQPLGAQTINGNLTVAGSISATGGGDLAVDDIGADVISANTMVAGSASFTSLSAVSGPWRTILRATTSYDAPSIAANSQVSTSFTVSGAAVGDVVVVGSSGFTAGIYPYAYVSTTDTVALVLFNNTTGAINPASNTYYVAVIK